MKKYQRDFITMGCPASIQIFASDDGEYHLDQCVLEAERFNKKYSNYLDASLLSKINAAAGMHSTQIDEETFQIFKYAGVCHKISHGLFDVSAGPLSKLWKKSHIPSTDQIMQTLTLVGWDKVTLSENSIYLPTTGMSLDLGGVVKEYAVDAIANLLQSMGITQGVVNFAGDICIVGPQPENRPWQIGISQPGNYANPIAFIEMTEGSITTSGSEERYTEIEGEKFTHLISPLTGRPVSGLKSVTVRANQTITAGSLSSIAMLMDAQDALKWLESLGVAYFAIDQHDINHGTFKLNQG
ncbi:MAG: thiamine biosynthesis lipoprotein [Candidatus Azotimanducaceae bacterium]|jgi:thiamine biosynthesis lipoprotein